MIQFKALKQGIQSVLNFRLESWAAIAPGLESSDEWKQWLQHPDVIEAPLGKIRLEGVPAMLRRRFDTLGKCAMGAALPLLDEATSIPSIFASRHGETEVIFALLEGIARGEPMSPTRFSLSVHNAISGLYSIARKDTSAVTAIAAMEGLVLQAFFEALGQLQSADRVLCVIYDMPLARFYGEHASFADEPFPYAIAMILGNRDGVACRLEQIGPGPAVEPSQPGQLGAEPLGLLRLLAGISDEVEFSGPQTSWRIARVEA
jgi:hypothetical protein